MSEKAYVRTDSSGALRVGDADISLDSVVIAFQDGHSPEAIQLQYPALTLEEVYGAITHFLAHRADVEQYLAQQAERWADLRRKFEQTPSPVVLRLRAMRQEQVGESA